MAFRVFQALCLMSALLPGSAVMAGVQCHVMVEDGQFGRIEICVSSVLEPQAGNNYGPANMVDGDPATAWVEGADGIGLGEWIELRFTTEMTFQTLEIVAGYSKSARLHALNAVPTQLAVVADGTPVDVLSLADGMEMQVLRLTQPVTAHTVRFEVHDAVPGAKWQDLAVSEFYIDLEELNYSSF